MIKTLLLTMLLQTPSDSVELVNSNTILEQVAELSENEKYEEAISLLKKVNPADSNYFRVRQKLLSVYNDAELYDLTIQEAPQLLAQPNDLRAQLFIDYGNAYLDKGELKEAQKIYLRALQEFPYQHVIRYNLGISYYREKQYAAATEEFQRCLKINPFYSSAHLMLGYICILQGQRTKGLLSYMMYLMLNPGGNSALVTAENLLNDAVRYEGSVPQTSDNSAFSYYDDLLKSKAALDKRYQSKVNFNASINKQVQLLLTKLKFDETSNDFWMQHYVPLFQMIQSKGYSEFTIYYLLKSVNNEEVNGWIEKNQKTQSAWADDINSQMKTWRTGYETVVQGKKDTYDFWYFDNNMMNAVGHMAEDETYYGPWEFYYDNAQLNAAGFYNKAGSKIGEWKYYYENGNLKRHEWYDEEGKVSAPVLYYREDGTKASEVPYEGDVVTGTVKYYFGCDAIKELAPYVDTKLNGQGSYWFESGARKTDYTIADGKLEGDYINYFQIGTVSSKYYYKEGVAQGNYEIFHNNDQLKEKGNYLDDELEGPMQGFFPDGTLSYAGSFSNGKKTGEWKYYYANGKLKSIENFNASGQLHGVNIGYAYDGFKTGEYQYNNDKVVGYKCFDRTGKILSQAADPTGNMTYLNYNWMGNILAKGTYVDGELTGAYEVYYEGGQLKRKGQMKEGNWDGELIEYYADGSINTRSIYQNGQLNGYYVSYYFNGQKYAEGHYINGLQEQNWKYYHANGQVESTKYFVNGDLQGVFEEFDLKGRKSSSLIYKDDVMIGFETYDTLGQTIVKSELPNGSGTLTYYYANGKKRFESVVSCGLTQDKYTRYYPDGKLLSETPMKYGSYHGTYQSFSELGKLMTTGEYYNNQKTGLWKYYDTQGRLDRTYHFVDNESHGIYERYYDNGKKESVLTYVQDEREGPSWYYDRNGNLQLIKYYNSDFGFYAYQYELPNGQLSDTIFFDGNTEVKAYFKNGKISSTQQYKGGKFHGACTYYNTDGQLIESLSFYHGEYDGEQKTYYSNGQLRSFRKYDKGEQTGAYLEYHPNGKVSYSAQYIAGSQEGWERYFDQNGKMIKQHFYVNDGIYE